MRINQYLAQAGLGSRRACERLVREGRVRLNGAVVEGLGVQVGAGDRVEVDGRMVRPQPRVWFAVHKPRGVLTTCADPHGRATVLDAVPYQGRLFPVGRLDLESEGLVLLTNDGELAQKLLHPRHGVEKEYEVIVDKPLTQEHKARLLRGFCIEGGRAKIERIHSLKLFSTKNNRQLQKLHVILRQGIKRQIRLMFYRLGYEVLRLKRLRIGPILLRGLPRGAYRPLTLAEIRQLQAIPASDQKHRKSASP